MSDRITVEVEADLEDLAPEVRDRLEVHGVEELAEVLAIALESRASAPPSPDADLGDHSSSTTH